MAKGMQNKSEDFSEGKSKSRNIAVILYPDNRYHMEYLDYLKEFGRGFYIKHGPESDEKKRAYSFSSYLSKCKDC